MMLVIAMTAAPHLRAAFSCSGILTDAQRSGFEHMFPNPYFPSLVLLSGPVAQGNMAKELMPDDLKRLSNAKPTVVRSVRLSAQHAILLKGWLNDNASATIPGWLSTSLGVLVPEAWVGLSADVFIQVLNGSGDAGRLTVANLAGTVSQGGIVGVTEQVTKDKSGTIKFVWTYVYQASLNQKIIEAPLSVCLSDVKALR
jgi:hypothetical protein